jgi:hypothetical protein
MSTTANASSFIRSAYDKGILSEVSLAALQIPDIGAAINNALGSEIEVSASEAVHVIMLMDDSGSIKFGWDENQQKYVDNSKVICDGHNIVIESLRDSKTRDGIFITTLLLNGNVINSFTHIDDAKILENGVNYSADGVTPLYDQSVVTIGSAIAKAQELAGNSIPCRSVILIATDGMDEYSCNTRVDEVKSVVHDVLQTEQYIIAAIGIPSARTCYDGQALDFIDIFKKMGIQENWFLTPMARQEAIRAAFQLFSQAATQASQNAESFSKTALGGFGN